MQSILRQLLRSPVIWSIVPSLILLELVALGCFYFVERSRLQAVEKDVTYGNGAATSPKWLWQFEMRGLQKPKTQPAAAARIAEGDEVIGLVANGKARAYWLNALRYPPWHIVNDLVDGIPVSVTYCDRTDCTQVYTSRESSAPLDINLAGLYGHEMIVKVAGGLYYQETGKPFYPGVSGGLLPYANYPWVRTTWKDWRARHPDTDLFIGLGGIGPRP